ncbi:hypothetical protein O0M58_12185, partial [Staphylococcus pseudintermedius]|nr:hypothetical protein [Staphylococcus pseudintermedius]
NTEKDSDGLIANIDVTQDDMSIDAGFFPLENWNAQPKDETYTIGDFVWRDEDHNGVQNDGEHGLEGVLVTMKHILLAILFGAMKITMAYKTMANMVSKA